MVNKPSTHPILVAICEKSETQSRAATLQHQGCFVCMLFNCLTEMDNQKFVTSVNVMIFTVCDCLAKEPHEGSSHDAHKWESFLVRPVIITMIVGFTYDSKHISLKQKIKVLYYIFLPWRTWSNHCQLNFLGKHTTNRSATIGATSLGIQHSLTVYVLSTYFKYCWISLPTSCFLSYPVWYSHLNSDFIEVRLFVCTVCVSDKQLII